MKKTVPVIIFICICLLHYSSANAQDKIYKADSTIVEAKVLEIGSYEIKYKKFSNQDGPTYTISKSKITRIVYENGEKESFASEKNGTANITNMVTKDSVQLIEELFGVKLENTQDKEGGVKIVQLTANSIFLPRNPLRTQATLDKLSIYSINNGKKIRVKSTSELARVLFKSYNQGISKIHMISGQGTQLENFTKDHQGIDISGLSKCQGADSSSKKLGIDESKMAGRTVEGIYNITHNWMMQGFCSGMVFGVAGIAVVGLIAELPPAKKLVPKAPSSVDANAWTTGYKSQIKKKRLISGVLGSIVGAVLVIGAFSSAQ